MKLVKTLCKQFAFGVAISATALLLSVSAYAQLTSGDLSGVVSDASQAAIPGATVSLLNNGTGVKTVQTTNAQGTYHFVNLPVGTYTLIANAAGFGTAQIKDVSVDLNKAATTNVILQIGTAATTVEVSESTVAVDTNTAQITNTFDTRQTADLPTASVGSGVLNLALLDAAWPAAVESAPPQFQQTVDSTGPLTGYLAGGGISSSGSSGALSAAQARAVTSGYIPDQKLPYSIQWNLSIQHTFAKDYTAEVRYVGTRGVHLDVQTRLNRQTDVTPSNSLPTFLSTPSQATLDSLTITLPQLQSVSSNIPKYSNAGFNGNVVAFMPWGNSTYHGLSMQLDRRFSAGLTFRGAYTWSHAIDDTTADVFSTVLSPRRVQDFQNFSAERASSALDHRQRFTLAAVYDLPFFRNGNWLMKNLVGNWEFAPIFTYQSPEFYTVQSGIDANLNGDSAGDRSIINANGNPDQSSLTTALKNFSGQIVGYLAINPSARYIQARAGAYANGGRNTLAGRPIDNLDFTAIKRFSIREGLKLELQGQFLNALNHAQFIAGSLNDIRSIGYTSSTVRNVLITGSNSFNNPESAFSSNPRTIQVAAKLVF